ncbi:siderophore ABC transporter substrate-binding protein [Bartonella sp. DGB2]|uniref:siderophore ABC transporter substrate-binding protein n=1 Tax=Bartonella sp. DGB2 TaxID=3388426 RepID=UPI0039903288
MKGLRYFIVGLLAIFLGGYAVAGADVNVKHASGETRVAIKPQKVVIFDLAVLDNADRLGVDTVVGVPEINKPDYLQKYDAKPYVKVGSLFEPNYETLANLKPDLIIVAARSQKKYAELSKIAPTIDLTIDYNHYLADIERNIKILGQIFDKEQQADTEIKALKARLSQVQQSTNGKGNALVIMTTGGKITAFGSASRYELLYSDFGIKPAVGSLKANSHGQLISPEFLLETNPEWLLVIDRDAAIGLEGQAAAQILDNAMVKNTIAGEKNQIIYLDPQIWYLATGGLTGLEKSMDQIEAAFKARQ